MPSEMAEETLLAAMRELTNPRSSEFPQLMTRLMRNETDVQFDHVYDSQLHKSIPLRTTSLQLRTQLIRVFSAVYNTHAAVELPGTLLMPKNGVLHAPTGTCTLIFFPVPRAAHKRRLSARRIWHRGCAAV